MVSLGLSEASGASCVGASITLVLLVAVSSRTYSPMRTSALQWELQDTLHLEQSEKCVENIEVLVAGASRTSTSSMQQVLQELGYSTTHWSGYMTRYFDFIYFFYTGRVKVPHLHKVFKDIPSKGALLDTVVPAMFDDLRRTYPNAKVILTTRDVRTWFKSYENYVAQCWLYHWTRFPLLFFLSHVCRALRIKKLFFGEESSGLDLDLLPELSEVFRKSDEVMYGSWQPRRDRTKESKETFQIKNTLANVCT